MHSDSDDNSLRDSIIGLGERSFQKSYYPQLRRNLERLQLFRSLLDRTQDFIAVINLPEGTITDANAALGRLLDQPVETLIGRPFASLDILVNGGVILEEMHHAAETSEAGDGVLPGYRICECTRQGTVLWLELTYVLGESNGQNYGVVIGRDISERMRNSEMLASLLAEKEALLENAMVGIVRVRHRQIISCNRRFEEMFGYPPGTMIGLFTRTLYEFEEDFKEVGEKYNEALARNQTYCATTLMRRADSSLFWTEIAGCSIDPAQHDVVWIVTDITVRKEAEERANFLTYHDSLTGLPNRLLFLDRFHQAMRLVDHVQNKIAIVLIDLDHFKTVNDIFGHSVGDQLLIEVANRISQSLGDLNTLCRYGGDEFLILPYNLTDLESCSLIINRLQDSIQAPFIIFGNSLSITASIGLSIYPDDGTDFEELLKKADIALYRAKEAGRNTYSFFNPELNKEVLERMTLHLGLRQGLELGQFTLHFQPQFDILRGGLIGAEALIRWKHPEHGLIPPSRFIPTAEESGLIIPLGEWVLREACCEAMRWQETGLKGLTVAVNLSAVQILRGGIEQAVSLALSASGLDPNLLELELTESMLIHDTEKVNSVITNLKKIGVKLSIDDFGTGYSSFAYLKRFKMNKLKIDRSFISDITTNPDDGAIVQAIIQMARLLGLKTIAEGVEHKHELDMLVEYGCDEVQGYLFSRPLPANEFISFYRDSLVL